MGRWRAEHRCPVPGHSCPRVHWLGNCGTQLPDSVARTNRPSEATATILPASFSGGQTTPTHSSFEPSGHLVGPAKTRGSFSGRPVSARPCRTSPSSGESGLHVGSSLCADDPQQKRLHAPALAGRSGQKWCPGIADLCRRHQARPGCCPDRTHL